MNASESERWISQKNCYSSIRLRVVQTDKTGTVGRLSPIVNTGISKAAATLVSIPFINPNAGACMFSSVSCDIGGQTISLNQNICQVNTIYRELYESENEQRSVNSTNPINVMTLKDTDTTANKSATLTDYFTGYPNTLTNFSNRKLYALKNMMNFNKYYEIEIQTQLLAPLFYSDEMIPPNTEILLKFTVDPAYDTNLISIAGSNVLSLPVGNVTPFSIGKLTSATSNAGLINSISVGVVDMNMWVYRVHMPNVVSRVKEINIKQCSSLLHGIVQGTHDEFNVDFKKNRQITHIACAFVQKKSQMKCCPSDFSSGFYVGDNNAGVDHAVTTAITEAMIYSQSPIMQLLNFRIEYAGGVYPFQPYTYNFDHTEYNTNAQYLSNSTFRSYYDMCNFSSGLRDRAGVLLSADQYVVSPLIIFQTHQNPDNDHNTCLKSLDFKNPLLELI